jgi:hypothetical protein
MERRGALALLLALWAPAARAQEAWPPPLPELPRSAAAAPASASPFSPGLLELLLPKIVENGLEGCGPEAGRVLAWLKGREGVGLNEEGLVDGAGARLAVSPALAAALRNAQSYFGLTPATQAAPPTHAEIVSAALAPAGVEAVARIFERTIAARLVTATGVVVPEAGGEATLDGGLRLHEIPEMTRAVLPLVVRDAKDPEALARLYESRSEEMKAIDPDGLLANFLKSRPAWIARGLPQERIDHALSVTVDGLLHNATDSYIFDPQTQLAAVVSQSWSGRYLGRWHTHPPHAGANGWASSDGPSPPDMDIAVSEGQNMVFAFSPDGFDLYDLAPLAGAKPDLNKVLKESYRSDAWRRRFQDLFDRSGRP